MASRCVADLLRQAGYGTRPGAPPSYEHRKTRPTRRTNDMLKLATSARKLKITAVLDAAPFVKRTGLRRQWLCRLAPAG
jgi:hypothetical protein